MHQRFFPLKNSNPPPPIKTYKYASKHTKSPHQNQNFKFLGIFVFFSDDFKTILKEIFTNFFTNLK